MSGHQLRAAKEAWTSPQKVTNNRDNAKFLKIYKSAVKAAVRSDLEIPKDSSQPKEFSRRRYMRVERSGSQEKEIASWFSCQRDLKDESSGFWKVRLDVFAITDVEGRATANMEVFLTVRWTKILKTKMRSTNFYAYDQTQDAINEVREPKGYSLLGLVSEHIKKCDEDLFCPFPTEWKWSKDLVGGSGSPTPSQEPTRSQAPSRKRPATADDQASHKRRKTMSKQACDDPDSSGDDSEYGDPTLKVEAFDNDTSTTTTTTTNSASGGTPRPSSSSRNHKGPGRTGAVPGNMDGAHGERANARDSFIRQLLAEQEAWKAEKKGWEKKAQDWKAEKESLEAQKRDVENEKEHLEEKNARLEEKCVRLEEKGVNLEEKNARLKEENERLVEEDERSKTIHRALTNELMATNKKLHEAKERKNSVG
ncbi:uncharacterized protein K452DRAFT_312908 [Aplosporella prunicola CBS 121167]|uniref:Uncharacterized protein n=1 Tax=Aplosporella prunicola CBS 121167 TaxID=1176127 RepID=A0A6A6AZU9_9PEZI|nr:uncharacterized protein K452DRAFT_312908 [Aplosporella prunicola CBS 121167]KAF2136798.1 hypothetical protein K452DRAFT_312908 [Aplosporella prunicola CBS 121167]